jgi:hypothetical protein
MEKKEILSKAQDAFWEVIALNHPEIKTGDFGPTATLNFDEACEWAYESWTAWNCDARLRSQEQ